MTANDTYDKQCVFNCDDHLPYLLNEILLFYQTTHQIIHNSLTIQTYVLCVCDCCVDAISPSMSIMVLD